MKWANEESQLIRRNPIDKVLADQIYNDCKK